MKKFVRKIVGAALNANPWFIKHFNAGAIRFIDNPSEDVQFIAVKANIELIKQINNPSEDVLIYVVLTDPTKIMDIENPSELVQMSAVSKDPKMIAHISNSTRDVQMQAVSKNYLVVKLIKNPHADVTQYVNNILDAQARNSDELTSDVIGLLSTLLSASVFDAFVAETGKIIIDDVIDFVGGLFNKKVSETA